MIVVKFVSTSATLTLLLMAFSMPKGAGNETDIIVCNRK